MAEALVVPRWIWWVQQIARWMMSLMLYYDDGEGEMEGFFRGF